MSKKIIALFGFLILAVCLSACSVKDPRRGLSKQLGIDLMNDGTALLHETDTIGWFGDGYILSELECSDECVLNDIMNDEHWKRLPLSENMHRFFYEDYHFPSQTDAGGHGFLCLYGAAGLHGSCRGPEGLDPESFL